MSANTEEQSPLVDSPGHPESQEPPISRGPIVLVGNPNAGKTTLFNQLTGMRVKTANFPGTTLDLRTGHLTLSGVTHDLIDMPGLYNFASASAEERLALQSILNTEAGKRPAAVILILDATNLIRNLFLASQVLELGIPTVVALNMTDLAKKAGIEIDIETLESHLGCPVAPVVARRRQGLDKLLENVDEVVTKAQIPSKPKLLKSQEHVTHGVRYDWAETVGESCIGTRKAPSGRKTEAADKVLTHPVGGVAVFIGVLFAVFYLIFSFATIPMDFIDATVGRFGAYVGGIMPEGQLNSLLVDGVIAGVGGVLVFLPQICILFFCLSILEDTGYLARAACVMDRVLRKVGLPGKAFVPMLSAHACAIPAIMSARVIENKNDRLVTILVLPLLTCSARLPVYAMVTALLFPYSPFKGAMVFTGAYTLGIAAAMSMAFVFRRALVKGETAPLLLELPNYKLPGLKTALLTAYDRGIVFVKKAGTVILAISIVLWWLMSYPQYDPAQDGPNSAIAATTAVENDSSEETAEVPERLEAQRALSHSFAGRLGHLIEPVIEPLGFNWQIGVGIVASFAAREVVVSALSVIYGVSDEEDSATLLTRLRNAERPDGSALFNFATCVSFLVFYVLAMQCLPTQAVTKRETGSWKWAGFQLGYMTILAYTASLITYQGISLLGIG